MHLFNQGQAYILAGCSGQPEAAVFEIPLKGKMLSVVYIIAVLYHSRWGEKTKVISISHLQH